MFDTGMYTAESLNPCLVKGQVSIPLRNGGYIFKFMLQLLYNPSAPNTP